MKQGVILRSATERIDESPSGRLVEGVLAAVNEYDNAVRKERVKIALWRRVEEGYWPWQPPVGYYPTTPGQMSKLRYLNGMRTVMKRQLKFLNCIALGSIPSI